ncbi:ribonuclease R [Isoalcanivorax beigongshangi]|uniref:Ribonuclease R n=1 Tax=Isoalcanivorax beigongshangi TaxID=3238810 RepID=A0ABV4ADT4_9GAMM
MSKKNRRYRDPYADREAAQYERPVASRELILQVLNDHGQPLARPELEQQLGIDDDTDREALRRRLKAMLRDGQLVENRRGQYGPIERMALIAGRVQGHRDGFGFVITDEPSEEDLFLSPRQMTLAMDGDRVLVSVEGRNRFGKQEARVAKIIERASTDVVGRFKRGPAGPRIEPSNRRITLEVLVSDLNGLEPADGDHVRAEILHYPSPREPRLVVRLVEIIAAEDQPGMEVDVALRSHEIPYIWPDAVQAAAAAFADTVSPAEWKGRVDLRDLPLVTIDGEDARDFDDAIFVERRLLSRGWRLVVAIADVSHYVTPGDELDREAHRRGTSVYFPNRVVPMLPEKLSNGLCSLNPDVDRLCLFCDMQVSAGGRITRFAFGEGVMRSHRRLTYTEVGNWLERPDSEEGQAVDASLDRPLKRMLTAYQKLFQALRTRREARGAIDFETVETRILYDDQKKISAIVPAERNSAHMMIEEAMLAANICAAKALQDAELPGLYRNHEPPKPEKLMALRDFVAPLGLTLKWSEKDGDAKPAVFQALNDQIGDRPDRVLIQTVMLRSLTQARYAAENKGHFGLAYGAYAHFTSPIRRYPDLLVHRALRYLIRNGDSGAPVTNPGKLPKLKRPEALPYDTAAMTVLGEHCSMTERRADDAARDVVQWLKCQYMEQHLGEEFEGVISGVTSFGLFVQINDLYVDGLVHVATLDSDYYRYDDKRHQLVGESSGRRYRLGDSVRVQIAAVHTEDRKIDLLLVDAPKPRGARKKPSVRDSLRSGDIPARGGTRSRSKAGQGGEGAPFEGQAARRSRARSGDSDEWSTQPQHATTPPAGAARKKKPAAGRAKPARNGSAPGKAPAKAAAKPARKPAAKRSRSKTPPSGDRG